MTARFGLIGCGVVATYIWLPELRRSRRVKLVAVADPDAAARGRVGRDVAAFEQPGQLLERDDIDAVLICAPTHLHAELAVAAAQARKHFYLEKPIAHTSEDARRVMEAANGAGVKAAIGFNRRCHPLFEQARELIRVGAIGRVRFAATAFCEPVAPENIPGWKRARSTGGGVLLDLGSHHIDLLRWFLNDDVAAIEAQLASDASEHDTARVRVTMRGGVEAQSFFSFRAAMADYLEFIGEKGTLRVDRHSPKLTFRMPRRFGYGVRERWVRPSADVAAWRLRRLAQPSIEPSYGRALDAFVDLIHGAPRHGASIEDGLASLEAILAAER